MGSVIATVDRDSSADYPADWHAYAYGPEVHLTATAGGRTRRPFARRPRRPRRDGAMNPRRRGRWCSGLISVGRGGYIC